MIIQEIFNEIGA